jgi:hypothetical protein
MSSRNSTVALSKFNPEKYSEILQFLRDFMDMFKRIKIGANGTWKPCQTGVLLSTQSILELQDLFLNKKKYKFLLTARFSQDCLENLFSCLKSIQPIPNALQFMTNLKLVCIAQYLKNSSNTRTIQELELYEDFDNSEIFLGNTEQNCLYNIAGKYNDILFLKL